MKKFFLLMIALMCAIGSVSAAPPTTDQVNAYKNSLVKYIRDEGYSPSIDSDGDIKFKNEGKIYYIRVESYDDGYYVNLFRVLGTDGYTKSAVMRAANDAMCSYKFVKCYVTSSGDLYTSYAWLCFTLTDFKVMFENAMDVIGLANEKIADNL